MNPRHLRMEAFGPYGGVAEIDFEPLAEVGLFVVSGPTGAGKSSIFDAICYALYGSLSGARRGHADVRSHHAAPAAECQVTLEFEVSDGRYRVWRRPAQERAKKRGSGTTEDPAKATLEREVDGVWESITARVTEVNAHCRDLVGLTLEQFERVVLLPQGRFAEVLNARTADRTELFRTLFGSEIYERVADVLAEQVRARSAELDGVQQQAVAVIERAEAAVVRAEAALGSVGLEPEAPAPPPADLGQLSLLALSEPAATDESAEVGPDHRTADPDDRDADLDLHERARRLRVPAERLHGAASVAEAAATTGRAELERAEVTIRNHEQRAEARARASNLAEQTAAIDELRRREQFGRAALPVLGAHDRQATAARQLADADGEEARCRTRAATAAAAAGLVLDPSDIATSAEPGGRDALDPLRLAGLVADRRAQVATAAEAAALGRRAAADLAGVDDRRAAIDRAEAADDTAEREHTAALLAADLRRASLARLATVLPERERACRDLLRRLEQRRDLAAATARQEAHQRDATSIDRRMRSIDRWSAAIEGAIERLDRPDDRAAVTAAAVVDAEERVRRAERLARLDDALQQHEVATADAAARVTEVMAAYVASTAPRLARQLQPDAPCPVCGSCEHPDPAHLTDGEHGEEIDLLTVQRATDAASEAAGRLEAVRAERSALCSLDPHLGDLDVAGAQADLAAARRRDDLAQRDCVRLRRLARGLARRIERGDDLAEQAARLRTLAAEAALEVERQRGALGDQAEVDHEVLVAELSMARGGVRRAEHAAVELVEVDSEVVERRAALDALATARTERFAERAALAERADRLTETMAETAATRAAIVGEADVAVIVDAVAAAERAVEGWSRATADRAEAATRHATQCDEFLQSLAASPFESLEAAADLVAAVDELDGWAATIEEHVTATTRVEAVLRSLDELGLPVEPPDVDALRARALDLDAEWRRLAAADGEVRESRRVAATELGVLADIDRAHADARAELDLLQQVAQVVRGNNRQRLSLENWVLKVYLDDVVAHANVHLHEMSRGRYRLQVQDGPSNQVGQHGLGLVVDDAHTGRVRPTVSLSGGETFQASLALALGLADVVMVGRAGLHLDALFVDEGFGSLDAESIDQAISVLDGLRSRGSMVGVITHVEAMKAALPVAIDVRRRADDAGSEIRQVA